MHRWTIPAIFIGLIILTGGACGDTSLPSFPGYQFNESMASLLAKDATSDESTLIGLSGDLLTRITMTTNQANEAYADNNAGALIHLGAKMEEDGEFFRDATIWLDIGYPLRDIWIISYEVVRDMSRLGDAYQKIGEEPDSVPRKERLDSAYSDLMISFTELDEALLSRYYLAAT